MKRGVNLLVLHNSKEVAANIVDLVRTTTEVEDVFFGSSFDKPIQLLYANRVDLVICGLHLTEENVLTLDEMRQTGFPFSLIVLNNNRQSAGLNKYFVIPEEKMIEILPSVLIQATKDINCSAYVV